MSRNHVLECYTTIRTIPLTSRAVPTILARLGSTLQQPVTERSTRPFLFPTCELPALEQSVQRLGYVPSLQPTGILQCGGHEISTLR